MNPQRHQEDTAGSICIGVTLKVFGGLRQLRTSPVEERSLPSDSTVEELWTELAHDAPEFVERIRDGVDKGYLHILVNGRNIVFLDGPATRLHDGDTVAVLPPIGGG